MKINHTEIFIKNWDSDKFITINRGGSRSSKTRSLCQLALVWLLTGTYSSKRPAIKSGMMSIVRRFSATIDSTVMSDLEEEIEKQGVWGLIQKNIQKKTYKHGLRTIQFIGADDQQKLRGRKQNILYCNEANELGYDSEFFQLLLRTTDKIFIDFNPDDEDIWINTELEQKRMIIDKDVDLIVSTYRDNTFLSKQTILEMDRLKRDNFEAWKVWGNGEYGHKVGLIYTHWNLCDTMPEGDEFYGLDFGFNNPSAMVRCVIKDDEVYCQEVFYEKGKTNSDLIQMIKALEIGYLPIYCDSAEPNRIEEMVRAGLNAKPADKGKDSVKKGIDTVKSRPLHITADSPNLLREIRAYSWMVGKDKKADPENPVKYNDHLCDAQRMAIYTHSKPSGWFGLG